MKHPSNRAFFAYWDKKRDGERAPDRRVIEPSAVRQLLGDIFVLSYEPNRGYPFRVAGTRVSALLDRDLKGENFAALFAAASRNDITDILGIVSEELVVAVAGLTATERNGSLAYFELLLLPFNNRAHSPTSLTGLLAPMQHSRQPVANFTLASWRYLNPPPQRFVPRALKKLAIARGFMVYEGLR
ncbi:hypothetical protein NB311A_01285 [Nitrobacter sp. Nb-311A]|uniref:PAS domain-containing protein n=1 Tax=unclassified Nitrobacter TaxID=2620411 RepID=UPI00006866C4|nr:MULTISPECIES: PAS domain-containing protein [unclassified Nitrobacter]EAQ35963.1 hypothetical protein NB311A_01285 [Nitrobacter sp. Nb-311A]MCB1393991.1 PAS domain-containing protein [Nitrobacter sp.]MCV0387254.1 PAS domain-containing protein [Nitrobacter sp.]